MEAILTYSGNGVSYFRFLSPFLRKAGSFMSQVSHPANTPDVAQVRAKLKCTLAAFNAFMRQDHKPLLIEYGMRELVPAHTFGQVIGLCNRLPGMESYHEYAYYRSDSNSGGDAFVTLTLLTPDNLPGLPATSGFRGIYAVCKRLIPKLQAIALPTEPLPGTPKDEPEGQPE